MSGVGMIPSGCERGGKNSLYKKVDSGTPLSTEQVVARRWVLPVLCDAVLIAILVVVMDLVVLLSGKGPLFSSVREPVLLFPALLGISWPWMLPLLFPILAIVDRSRRWFCRAGTGRLAFCLRTVLMAIPALFFFHWVIWDVLQGPTFAFLPGLPVLGWLGASVAAVLWSIGVVGAADGGVGSRWRWTILSGGGKLAAGALLLVVALGLHWFDGNVLIRLYPRLHATVFLFTCTLLFMVVVVSGLGRRLAVWMGRFCGGGGSGGAGDRGRGKVGVGVGAGLLVVILLAGSAFLGSDYFLNSQANLRFQIVSKCPGAGKLALMRNRASDLLFQAVLFAGGTGGTHGDGGRGLWLGSAGEDPGPGQGQGPYGLIGDYDGELWPYGPGDGGSQVGDTSESPDEEEAAAGGESRGSGGGAASDTALDGAHIAKYALSGMPRLRPNGNNVVLVTMDAVRASHCSVYGFERQTTPFLEELAKESALFIKAYTQSSHTSYSLSMLMSSRYMYQPETHNLAELPTMASVLGKAGYATMAVYSQYLFFSREDLFQPMIARRFGFEKTDNRHLDGRQAVDSAIEMLDEHFAGQGREFFLWVHLFDAHEPYDTQEEFSFGNKDVDRYHGEIAFADSQIRRLVEYLNTQGAVGENTVLVVAADHGEEFGDHGGAYHGSSLYDEQARVPLLIRYPAGLEKQKEKAKEKSLSSPTGEAGVEVDAALVVDEPVQLIDIFPTLLTLTGLNPPQGFKLQGTDLSPALLHGREINHGAYGAVLTKRMVVSGQHKFIVNFATDTRELYHLADDPWERRNVLDQEPERAKVLERMLSTWVDGVLVGTRDPVRWGLALARLGDPRSVPILRAILANSRLATEIRIEAVLLLGSMGNGDPETVAALQQVSKSGNLVGDCAVVTLAMLGVETDQVRLGSLQDASAIAVKMGRNETDWPRQIARRAAIARARTGNVDAVPFLQKILDEEDRDFEEVALAALGSLKAPEALAPLLYALQPLRTRHWAVCALGELGLPDGAVPLLQIARNDPYTNIRESAIWALGMIGNRITPAAGEMLHELILDEPYLKGGAQTLINTGLVAVHDAGAKGAAGGRGGNLQPSVRGAGVVLGAGTLVSAGRGLTEAGAGAGGDRIGGAFRVGGANGASLCLEDGGEGYLVMPALGTGDYNLLASAFLADGVGEGDLKFMVVQGAGAHGALPGKAAMKKAVCGGELHLPDSTMRGCDGKETFRLRRGKHLVAVKNHGTTVCLESVVLLKARKGKGKGAGK